MSKRVYFAFHGEPAPYELIEWQLVLETGWTLEYIRSLSMGDFNRILQIKDGMGKARDK